MKKWYSKLLDRLVATKADVLLVTDSVGVLNSKEFLSKLNNTYEEIIRYQSEIRLRRKLRNLEGKVIVVFNSQTEIPYDLETRYASYEITSNDTFSLLDEKTISTCDVADFGKIFELYVEESKEIYQSLTESETKELVEKSLKTSFFSKIEIKEITQEINTLLSEARIKQEDWGKLSEKVGRLKYILHNQNQTESNLIAERKINKRLVKFIRSGDYKDLIYNPKSNLNSHIIDGIWNKSKKVALICFDAMGFEEWNAIRDYLKSKLNQRVRFKVSYCFSMLPTITNYSRLSLFAGLLPKKIRTRSDILELSTRYEEKLFKEKLKKKFNIPKWDVFFDKRTNSKSSDIDHVKNYDNLGIVFTFVDENTHSSINKRMLINNLKIYLEDSKLDRFVSELMREGFSIWFASDHGSLHTMGNDVSIPTDLIEEKAKRCAVFAEESLAYEKKSENSEIIQLEEMIGEEYLLLLTGNDMFGTNKRGELTHGGISLEEMIVPLIEVRKK